MQELLNNYLPNVAQRLPDFGQALKETLVMVAWSGIICFILGLTLGVLITVTKRGAILENSLVYQVLDKLISLFRSIPFIILLVALIPFTRWIVGTSLGVPGAIVPLVVASAPFVGRMVEQSLAEVDGGLVEAAQSFGASVWQIVTKVFLKESLPSLIRGVSITFITLFGYSAMAGTVGAGGLGDIAIRYGYQRYQDDVMIAAVILCIVLVQVFQSAGDIAARKVDKR